MGMEFRPYYLAREWVKMGHRVDILAADFSHLRTENPKVDHDFSYEMIDGIRYHWVRTRTYDGNGAARAITMEQFLRKLWFAAKKISRKLEPDVIITHSPDDYMPDHTAVSKLVFDASFAASVPHYLNGEAAALTPVYYMDTLAGVNFLPTEYVDITDTVELKLEMLECHESQMKWMRDHDHIDFAEFVRTCARFRGLQCGVQYAEGFRPCMAWPKLTTKRMLP